MIFKISIYLLFLLFHVPFSFNLNYFKFEIVIHPSILYCRALQMAAPGLSPAPDEFYTGPQSALLYSTWPMNNCTLSHGPGGGPEEDPGEIEETTDSLSWPRNTVGSHQESRGPGREKFVFLCSDCCSCNMRGPIGIQWIIIGARALSGARPY